jgi:hypothetical protein
MALRLVRLLVMMVARLRLEAQIHYVATTHGVCTADNRIIAVEHYIHAFPADCGDSARPDWTVLERRVI